MLAEQVDPAAAAEFLVMSYWGFGASLRLFDEVAALEAPMRMVVQAIEGWRARPAV